MNFFRRIKEEKTVKDSALVLISNVVSQATSFLIALIVSRGLSVAEYGLYTVLNSISTFVSDMADMGMNGGITRFVAEFRANNDEKSEKQLVAYALKRKIINWIAVFVIMFFGARLLAEYMLHDASKYAYLYIIALISGFSLLTGGMRAVLQGRQEFQRNFISIVTWCTVWFLVMLLLGISGKLNVASSLIAQMISGLVGLILSFKLVNIHFCDIKQSINANSEIKKKFNSFGNWMVLWSVFALLQSKVDVFMLATFTTAEQVSYYDIATKISKPVLMIIAAYAQVLNPQFATLPDKKAIKDKIRKISKFITVISAAVIIGIFVAKPAILILFGTKYAQAIIPCQMLLFAIIFYIWTVPFNSALYALNMPYVFTIAALVGLVVTVVGNYYLLGRFGAIGAAVTYIAAQMVGLIVSIVAYLRNEKREQNE